MVDKLLLNKLGYTIVFAFFVIFIVLLIIVNCTGTEIKKSYATPEDNPKGLAWDGEYLWLVHDQDSDTGLITKIDPNNGVILDAFSSPGNEPKGLTFGDNHLWIIDKQNYEYYIFKLDPSEKGKVKDYFSLDIDATLNIKEPVDLAYGGNHMWVIDREDKKIYNIDLLEKSYYPINIQTESPMDLAWDGSNLYVASDSYNLLSAHLKTALIVFKSNQFLGCGTK